MTLQESVLFPGPCPVPGTDDGSFAGPILRDGTEVVEIIFPEIIDNVQRPDFLKFIPIPERNPGIRGNLHIRIN